MAKTKEKQKDPPKQLSVEERLDRLESVVQKLGDQLLPKDKAPLLARCKELESDLAELANLLGQTFGEPLKTKAAKIIVDRKFT